MTDLNDKMIRQKLIRRYLNAETTIEEEHLLLEYYLHTKEELTPEEEDLRLIIISTKLPAGNIGLSEEKEAEFDRMMERKTVSGKSHRALPKILVPSSLVAALILALFMMTRETVKDTLVSQQHATTSTTTKSTSESTSIKDRPQQDGKEANLMTQVDSYAILRKIFLIKEEDRDVTQQLNTMADEQDMNESNISATVEDRLVAAVIQPTEKEKLDTEAANTIIANKSVEESTDCCYSLNVTAANYDGKHKDNRRKVPFGNITVTTKTGSNDKSAHYTIVNSENGMRMLSPEIHDDSVIYIVDGKRVTKETANRIAPESIKEIRRLKRGSSVAIKEHPYGLNHDIILITTKRSDADGQGHSSVPRGNALLVSDNDNSNGICLL